MAVDTVQYIDGTKISPPVLSVERHTKYSTGRGGAGNIRKHDPVQVRVAQDVPQDFCSVPRATAVGRGGFGNIMEMRKRQAILDEAADFKRFESTESYSSMSSTVSRESKASSKSGSSFSKLGKRLFSKR